MDCGEFFVAGLAIDPALYDVWIFLILFVAQCFCLRDPQQLSEYYVLVLYCRVVKQSHTIIILQGPNLHVLRQLCELLLKLLDLLLLLFFSFLNGAFVADGSAEGRAQLG